jgi:ubiquitin carboxyl-terminal hydrolase 47
VSVWMHCWCAGAGASSFTSLDLAIRDFGCTKPIGSIQEGLREYFKVETLEGREQYHCGKCEKEGRGALQDAEKGLKLTKVPYILSIGLKRFDYDWERDCRIKIDDEVIFPPVLDMAEFLDPAAPAPESKSAPPLQPEPSAGIESAEASARPEEGTPPVENCGFGTFGFSAC